MNIRDKYALDEKLLAKTKKIKEDDIRRVVKKLAAHFSLESIGASEIEVPDDIEPSSLNPFECLRIFQAYQKTALSRGHPSELFPAFNVESDIKITAAEVYVEGVKYPVKQCTVIAGDQGGLYLNASALGDMLATSYRYTPTGYVHSIQKLEERTLMCVPDMKCLNKIPEIGIKERNPRQTSYAYFDVFTAKPKIAIPLMSDLISKMDSVFYAKSGPMTEAYKKMSGNFKREVINLPKMSIPNVRIFDNLDLAYRFHERSKSFRGEDAAGVGALSSGYYLIKMPRHYAKAWSFCQDMRFIMSSLLRKNKYVNFTIPPSMFILNVLVANGFCCGVSSSQRKFNEKDPVPGLYFHVPGGILYRDIGTKGPAVTKRGVTYMKEGDFFTLLESIKSDDVIPIHLNCYMAKLLEEDKIGVIPSSMPHNGVVYLGIFKTSFSFVELVKRFSRANSFRNTFVFHRVPFICADPYGKNYKKAVIFPKTRIVSKKDELYDQLSVSKETVEMDLLEDIVDITEVPQDVVITSTIKLWNMICNQVKGSQEQFIQELADAGDLFFKGATDIKFEHEVILEILNSYDDMESLLAAMQKFGKLYDLYVQYLVKTRNIPSDDEDDSRDNIRSGNDKSEDEKEEKDDEKNDDDDDDDNVDLGELMTKSVMEVSPLNLNAK